VSGGDSRVLSGLEKGKMMSDKEVFNSYSVQYVFDYSIITATVFALHEDAAPDIAAGMIYEDLGFSNLSSFLNVAQEVNVELVDRAVL
jgi:hypothetical protein